MTGICKNHRKVLLVKGDGEDVLAGRAVVAATVVSETLGLMFKRNIETGSGLIFDFDQVADVRALHMVFVRFDVDALWLVEDEVRQVERLEAWTGRGRAKADTVVELPAGAADGVSVGDTVRVVS
jgi:uncharacterized membrane protein (UPF0127 family)